MPEVLKFEDLPNVLVKFHIEPFREEYIPGAKVLCREVSSNGQAVFFQIPSPIARQLENDELEGIKRQIHAWWLAKSSIETESYLTKNVLPVGKG
jgi:hypothetical protein